MVMIMVMLTIGADFFTIFRIWADGGYTGRLVAMCRLRPLVFLPAS